MTKKTHCKEYLDQIKRSECTKRHVVLFLRIFVVLFILLAGIAIGIIYQSFIELKTSKTLEIDRQTQYLNRIATSGLVLLADAGKDIKYIFNQSGNLLNPNVNVRSSTETELKYFSEKRQTFYYFRIIIQAPIGNQIRNLLINTSQVYPLYQMPGGVADIKKSIQGSPSQNITIEFAINPTNFINILRDYLTQIDMVTESGNHGFPSDKRKFSDVHPQIQKKIKDQKNPDILSTYNFDEGIYTVSFLKFDSPKVFYLIIVEETNVILADPLYKFRYKIISTSVIAFVCLLLFIFGSFIYSQYRVREETSRKLVKTLKSIGRKKSLIISENDVDDFLNKSTLENSLIPELVHNYNQIDGVLENKMAQSLFFRYLKSKGESKRVIKFFLKIQNIQKQHETIKTTYVMPNSALEINVSNDQRQNALDYDNGLARLRDNLKQYFDEKYFNDFKCSNFYQIIIRNDYANVDADLGENNNDYDDNEDNDHKI